MVVKVAAADCVNWGPADQLNNGPASEPVQPRKKIKC